MLFRLVLLSTLVGVSVLFLGSPPSGAQDVTTTTVESTTTVPPTTTTTSAPIVDPGPPPSFTGSEADEALVLGLLLLVFSAGIVVPLLVRR